MSIRGLGWWVTPPAPAWGLDALPPWPGNTEAFELGFEFKFEFAFAYLFGFEYVESTEFRLELDLELDLKFDLEFGLERFFLRSLGFSFR